MLGGGAVTGRDKGGTMRVLAVVSLVVVIAACGGDGGQPTTTAAPPTSEAGGIVHEIVVSSFTFAPSDIVVEAGDSVRFRWDAGPHTATARDGAFLSGTLSGGATMTVSFAEPGIHEFFCEIHPSMTGRITVNG